MDLYDLAIKYEDDNWVRELIKNDEFAQKIIKRGFVTAHPLKPGDSNIYVCRLFGENYFNTSDGETFIFNKEFTEYYQKKYNKENK